MSEIDWDDESNVDDWCAEQRENVARYLKEQPIEFGEIGESPVWHVAPYVSLWAVESAKAPGKVGWWVISGDLPTDYASGAGTPDPRSAVAVIAKRWEAAAAKMEHGEQLEDFRVGDPERALELAPLLKSRAGLLLEWVDDDSCWED